jgi:hypothetical protein
MSGNSSVPDLICLLDAGRLDSAGRIVTASGESLEIAICNFDLATSGFRRIDDGWIPVFVHQHDDTHRTTGVTLIDESGEFGPRFTEAEIAAALKAFRRP